MAEMKRGQSIEGEQGEKMRMEGGKKGGPESDKVGGHRSGLQRDGEKESSTWSSESTHSTVRLDCFKRPS